MNNIIFEDLTEEDLANCRIGLRQYVASSGRQMEYEDFVKTEIKHYNLGYPSIIKPKVKQDLEAIADIFEEAKETAKAPNAEANSNIGKKIYLECTVNGLYAVVLVGTSEEADPDNNKISIHSDLGKLLHNVKENEIIEFHDYLIEIIKISSYSIPSNK